MMETNAEILTKAIRKAIAGGWKNIEDFKVVDLGANDVGLEYAGTNAVVLPTLLIFQQQFAKALWGDGKYCPDESGEIEEWEITLPGGVHKYLPGKNWKYHLQQMVIADDPIQYLGENI